MKRRDPSDTVEAVDGEAGADVSERASCGKAENAKLRGDRGSSPSIATRSNDASSCTDTWGDIGGYGCGVWNVVRAGPT